MFVILRIFLYIISRNTQKTPYFCKKNKGDEKINIIKSIRNNNGVLTEITVISR